jgi:hypothetical protein
MGMRPCGEDDQRIVLQPELSVRNIYLNYQWIDFSEIQELLGNSLCTLNIQIFKTEYNRITNRCQIKEHVSSLSRERNTN